MIAECERAVWAVLDQVVDPCSASAGCPLSLVEMGLVTKVAVDADTVAVVVRPTSPGCSFVPLFLSAAEELLRPIAAGRTLSVTLSLDADWSEAMINDAGRRKLSFARARPAASQR